MYFFIIDSYDSEIKMSAVLGRENPSYSYLYHDSNIIKLYIRYS